MPGANGVQKFEPSPKLLVILTATATGLCLGVLVLDRFTPVLTPVAELIPDSWKRVNLVIAPVITALALVRRVAPLPWQVLMFVLFCASGIVVGIAGRQWPFAALLTGVVLYIEIFCLIPRVNRRLGAKQDQKTGR
jgi:hypothetical protein